MSAPEITLEYPADFEFEWGRRDRLRSIKLTEAGLAKLAPLGKEVVPVDVEINDDLSITVRPCRK